MVIGSKTTVSITVRGTYTAPGGGAPVEVVATVATECDLASAGDAASRVRDLAMDAVDDGLSKLRDPGCGGGGRFPALSGAGGC